MYLNETYTKKWAPVLDHGDLAPITDPYNRTLAVLWTGIEARTPRFYQKSFKFDRPVAHHGEIIRSFFDKQGVFATCRNYNDPKVGSRSWLTLIAMRERFSKYKPMVY